MQANGSTNFQEKPHDKSKFYMILRKVCLIHTMHVPFIEKYKKRGQGANCLYAHVTLTLSYTLLVRVFLMLLLPNKRGGPNKRGAWRCSQNSTNGEAFIVPNKRNFYPFAPGM